MLATAIHGRPRGFIDWTPQPKTRALIEQVQAILDEYRGHLPLALRQVFYRLVGAHGYAKPLKPNRRSGGRWRCGSKKHEKPVPMT